MSLFTTKPKLTAIAIAVALSATITACNDNDNSDGDVQLIGDALYKQRSTPSDQSANYLVVKTDNLNNQSVNEK